ncbi:hypothetical protein [Cribrihabitans pelagius]|uniref:hypothetical protein n=1 Tax=Cribrihabitans pelagius TaxID=1765746 RepID=UPI003B5B982F
MIDPGTGEKLARQALARQALAGAGGLVFRAAAFPGSASAGLPDPTPIFPGAFGTCCAGALAFLFLAGIGLAPLPAAGRMKLLRREDAPDE